MLGLGLLSSHVKLEIEQFLHDGRGVVATSSCTLAPRLVEHCTGHDFHCQVITDTQGSAPLNRPAPDAAPRPVQATRLFQARLRNPWPYALTKLVSTERLPMRFSKTHGRKLLLWVAPVRWLAADWDYDRLWAATVRFCMAAGRQNTFNLPEADISLSGFFRLVIIQTNHLTIG